MNNFEVKSLMDVQGIKLEKCRKGHELDFYGFCWQCNEQHDTEYLLTDAEIEHFKNFLNKEK